MLIYDAPTSCSTYPVKDIIRLIIGVMLHLFTNTGIIKQILYVFISSTIDETISQLSTIVVCPI